MSLVKTVSREIEKAVLNELAAETFKISLTQELGGALIAPMREMVAAASQPFIKCLALTSP